jgi:hypothetical protein
MTFITFILLPLVISSVYYDPIQAESGGEAVQLYNNGTAPVQLDQFLLTTKQTTYPLPSTTLLPGQGYLIADTGWSTLRDNLTWSLADYEIGLSLANTEGWIAVVEKQTNETVSKLQWNSTYKAREGKLLTAEGEAEATFFNSNSTRFFVPMSLLILQGKPSITTVTITDDAPQEGIQLLSYERTITVQAVVEQPNNSSFAVRVRFNGHEYASSNTNGTWVATVPMTALTPGTYTLVVEAYDEATTVEKTIAVTVLSSSSIHINGELEFQGIPGTIATSSVTIENTGNTDKHVRIIQTIPGLECTPQPLLVAANTEEAVQCTYTIPANVAGRYNYTVQLVAYE